MNQETTARITAEIAALTAVGVNPADILVSVTANGEAVWGDAMALETSEMEAAMTDAGLTKKPQGSPRL